MTSYLVMLQTNSNQPFIFSSPRLREQIGASFEITLLSKWVKDKAEELLDTKTLPRSFWVSDSSGKVIVRFTEADGDPKDLAKRLIREVTLRALTDAPGLDVTGVFVPAAPGALEAKDLEKLDRVFSEYSLNRRPAAARFPQFPFLERADESALPAVAPLTQSDTNKICATARAVGVKESYEGRVKRKKQEKQEDDKDSQSTVLLDFNSILYTATKEDAKPDHKLSLPARFKRAWALPARYKQLDDVSGQLKTSMADLYRDPTRLEAAFQEAVVVEQEIVLEGEAPEDPQTILETTPPVLSSVGVVHIDGNGVGAIMRDLGKAFKETNNTLDKLAKAPYPRNSNPCGKKPPRFRPYSKKPPRFRSYSRKPPRFQWFIMEVNYRLDGVVKAAVAAAWKDVEDYARGRQAPPVVPVLVGGDDLTVYVEGKFAIPFAEAYIRHYEELTEKDELLKQLAGVAGANEAGPLTASAGVAIVGRNFPFHIAYDLAEELVSRGKKLGKKKDTVPCSTINFHVLRDATVLDAEETLDEYEGRTQRPFLVGHYAAARISYPATASSSFVWNDILRAVAVFDGKDPDSPAKTLGDPFPRARARRIVKLLAQETGADESQDEEEKITKRCKHPICTILAEWSDAQENASGGKGLVKRLTTLPSQARLAEADQATATISAADSADGQADEELSERQRLIGDCVEQVRWLLDLIDLSENLPDGYIAYIASLICPDGGGDADGDSSPDPADDSTTGGAK